MRDIVMGQGLGLGQLLPPPPSTTASSSPTIVVRTPPQSDGVAVQSHNSGSVDARPDKVPPIPPSIAADAAESLKFGTNTLQDPAAITQCTDSGCTVNPTAKPDKAPRPTVESLSSKLKTITLVQKPDGASIQSADLGCSCSKSDKVLCTPPSIFDAIEDAAGDFSGLDHADPKSNNVLPPLPSAVNAVEYGSTILEMKPTERERVKYPTWWGVDVNPTGWEEDEETSKKAVPMTNMDGNGEGVGVEVNPTGWEDEEISKKAVPMTNEDGNGEGVKYPTWWGVEVRPTGWEDEEISMKAVPMTNKDENGEGVKYPILTTGWEDGERSDKAVLKPNKDGSGEGVKYPERSAVKYPERPGQPDCWFYVHTGTCKFGLNCKFNHPAIRKTRTKTKPKKPPEPNQTGISKLPMASNTEEPVLGLSAPFHCPPAVTAAAEACPQSKILKEEELEGKSHGDRYHGQRPEGKANPEESVSSKEGKSENDFPQRPGKPDCSYYLNTGNCQFGSNCRFNHPSRRKGNKKDVPLGKTGNPESKADKGKQSKTLLGRTGQTERKINKRQYSVPGGNKFGTSSKHAHFPGKTEPGPVELNFLGLPMRPGERECTNYMHTGVCKFTTNCRFHHPNPTPVTAEDTLSASQNAAYPQQHASGTLPLPTTSWTLPNASCGPLPYPSPPYTPGFYPLPSQGIYPHPGWSEYQVPTIPSFPPEMVSGNSSTSKMSSGHGHGHGHVAAAHQPRQTLNSPERPGRAVCQAFVKTGHCKFRSACRYHHPKD